MFFVVLFVSIGCKLIDILSNTHILAQCIYIYIYIYIYIKVCIYVCMHILHTEKSMDAFSLTYILFLLPYHS